MKNLKFILLTLIIWSVTGFAKIPLEDFLKASEFKVVRISPDGKKLAGVMESSPGTDKIAILDLKNMKGLSSLEFGENRKISGLSWVNNDMVAMNINKTEGFLDRKGKWEALYLMKANGKKGSYPIRQRGKTSKSNGRAGSNKTKQGFATLVNGLPNEPDIILARVAHGNYYLARINIKSGIEYPLSRPADKKLANVWVNNNYDPVVAVSRWDPASNSSNFYYKMPKADSWKKLNFVDDEEKSISFAGSSKDPKIVYLFSNHDTSTQSLYKFNLDTGVAKKLYTNETADLGNTIYNLDRQAIGFGLMPDFPQVIWIDKKDPITQIYKGLQQSFPNQVIQVYNSTKDKNKMIFFVSSDTNPGDIYQLNRKNNKISKIVSTRSWVNSDVMASMKPITIQARDGITMHGYLTLPKGKEDAKNLPMIVNPHGGPYGPRDVWSFNRDVQIMANEGYAVLQLNFRGSGGYGRDFQSAGYNEWGKKMQDDLTDATHWAIDQGIANKDKICIYGGSYGGYATLQGVIKEPDLYQCGLGYVGVYDMLKFGNCGDIATSHFGQSFIEKVVGDDKEDLKSISPAYNAGKIKAKLFIAHGEDDKRVPMCQYNSLIKGLDDAGVDYISMTRDEGHGFHNPKNVKDFYTTMVKFFAENLK
jgi:dipeptidyl aminopeptidase/acylaminoacyl peptidase